MEWDARGENEKNVHVVRAECWGALTLGNKRQEGPASKGTLRERKGKLEGALMKATAIEKIKGRWSFRIETTWNKFEGL